MNIIVTALLAEAKPFIEYFALQKEEDTVFTIYRNDHTVLIVSGMTPCNSAIATTYILNRYKKVKTIINTGICASAEKNIPIGGCYQIRKLVDTMTHKVYHLPNRQKVLPLQSISTFATARNQNSSVKKGLADMESSGFYMAASKFCKKEDIYILKVVSDHLNSDIPKPHEVSNLTESLLPAIGKLLLT